MKTGRHGRSAAGAWWACTLGPGAGPGRARRSLVADAAAAAQRAGRQIRRPGLGAGLCLGADADGAGGLGRIWQPHAQPIREILVTDGKPGRAASPFSLHFDAEEVGAARWAISPRTVISAPRCIAAAARDAEPGTDRARRGDVADD